MERSVIRDRPFPDYAALHPGYEPTHAGERPYLFSRLTVISGTSVPGVTIDTDW